MTAQGRPRVAIIGGGPAGLKAAECAAAGGAAVAVFDAMPSVGRKFLVAGKGGLNLTHADRGAELLHYFYPPATQLERALNAFDGDAIREWANGLGIKTFVGSSGRVFPEDMKAAPLLRRWIRRLRERGIAFQLRHRWCGWTSTGALEFKTDDGTFSQTADATVLALGGGSWPKLGSDGNWVATLAAQGVEISPLRASNCGFECQQSEFLSERYAGTPIKSVALSLTTVSGEVIAKRGEFLLTHYGVEGSLIYALSAHLRALIERDGRAVIFLDLAPNRDLAGLIRELSRPRKSHTLAHQLQRRAGISGVKVALLHEHNSKSSLLEPATLAAAIKRVPLTLQRPRGLSEAISSAGGVAFNAVNEDLMLRQRPGVFIAGEMLDWDAPTGGYLLTACMATGYVAGGAAATWASKHREQTA